MVLSPEPTVDIFETVLNLRIQRTGMVQSKDQYKFVYVTIKDILMDRYSRYIRDKNRSHDLNLTCTGTDLIRTFIEKVSENFGENSEG